MKLGAIYLGYGILLVLLFMFGIISESANPFIQVFLNGGDWSEFFNLTGAGGLIAGATTLVGIASIYGVVTKNRYMIFGPLIIGAILNYTTAIYPIVSYFPTPLGSIIFAILSFLLVWTSIEFWGGVE